MLAHDPDVLVAGAVHGYWLDSKPQTVAPLHDSVNEVLRVLEWVMGTVQPLTVSRQLRLGFALRFTPEQRAVLLEALQDIDPDSEPLAGSRGRY